MRYYFSINMSYIEFLPYYQGQIQSVVVKASTGDMVQFPAMHLTKFLTSTGIRGFFCMETKNNKFLSLNKMPV